MKKEILHIAKMLVNLNTIKNLSSFGGRGAFLLFLCIFFSGSSIYAEGLEDIAASSYAGGTGTKRDPYIISNAGELVYFGKNYNGKTEYYKITNNIDLGGEVWTYHTTGTFKGHLIGEKSDGTKPIISNYKISVSNSSGSYGLLGNISSAEVRNIRISTVTVTLDDGITNAVKVGAFIGNVESSSLVEDCSAENIIVNAGSASTSTSYCSGFVGRIGTGYSVVRNCSVKDYSLTISGILDKGGNYAPLVGRMDCASLVEDCSTENITITTKKSLTGPNLSGLVGSMYGTSSTERAVITRCSVKNIKFVIEGTLGKIGIGSIVGWAGNSGSGSAYADITQCKTTGLKVYLSCNLNATSVSADIRLGGMVGKLEKDTKVTDCLLYGENYIGSNPAVSVDITFSRNLCMFVGGIVGTTIEQGTTSSSNQIVIERCVAYCDFDFTGYKYTSGTTGNLSKNAFVIGGVIGRLHNPYYIPKTLYYSGKVKAPYCVVGPLVGTFLKSKDSNEFIYNDYSGVNDNTNSKNADYSKWYYGDYQIWLTSSVINSGRTINGGYSDEGYATIGNVSGWTENKIGGVNGTGKKSKTILPYSSNGNNVDMSIYPTYAANNTSYPLYYMYYVQGVNRGNYKSSVDDDVLAALRAGDDGPVWDVEDEKIVMHLFKASEKMKSDDALKSVLKIETDGAAGLPSGYSSAWKIDDVPVADPNNVSRELTSQTATVSISKGGTVVETLSVTVPRAEWYDAGSLASTPTVKDGVYQIASKYDLAWMGYHISQTNAKNTDHYVLTADIDLDGAWWSPVNGMEEIGAGSFGGVFDGNGYTISNMHIDWDADYTGNANFGLFSIIEGASSQWAVVRNLIIDHAVVTKETNATVKGHRYVGILAGNVKEYSKIENVIVRNSEVSASSTASSQNSKTLAFGGLAARINTSSNNYNLLNISTDVNIDISTLTVNSTGSVIAGGVIAQLRSGLTTCVRNIYALGGVTAPSGVTNVGSVFGQYFSGLTNDVKATIFYVNSSNQNVGTQKSLAEYATTFLETANNAVDTSADLYPWIYSQTPGYALSHLRMRVVDNTSLPRFVNHELEIKGMTGVDLSAYTFEWYRTTTTTEKIAEATTYSLKPFVPGNNVSITIDVIKDGVKVGTLIAPVPYGIFEGEGTSASPFKINCVEELQMLSYLSNQIGSYEYNGKTTTEYNQAYYVLDGNVDLSGVTDFTPIGSVRDNYQAENCFRGHFDGFGNSIIGMKIGWLAGDVNAERNRVWGLFGAVQGTNSQKAVIQNLVIKNAVLTHSTDNSSFYYKNGSSGNANNCYVGVLAGLVGANTTIQNIEVSACSITDDGSSEYKIADHTLSVGGVIGRVQNSFSSDGDINSSTIIRLISSDCNITINHASFTTSGNANEYKINVAGIVGSMKSTGASATMPWPSCTYYTGQVSAVGMAMVSPVFANAMFSGNTNVNYDYYCNLYTGRVSNSDAKPVSNVFYGNYQIWYDGGYKSITDDYPAQDNNNSHRNPCDMDARTLVSHSTYSGLRWHHNKNFNDYYYQGVNYGTYITASNISTVISAFNAGRDNANDNGISGFGFLLGSDNKLHLDIALDITFVDNHLGDASELTHTLTVSNKYGNDGLAYEWYINGKVQEEHGNPQNIDLGVTPQLVYVKVLHNNVVKYTTNVIDLPRGYTFSADYDPKENVGTAQKINFTVTPEVHFTNGDYTITYAWKEWSNGSSTTLHYTAQECFDRNRPYIESVTQSGASVDVDNWSSDIYEHPNNYTVTYGKVYDVISSEDYAMLSAEDKVGYVLQSDGTYRKEYDVISSEDYAMLSEEDKVGYVLQSDETYRKELGVPYTPITTDHTYEVSSSGKIPVENGSADENVLSNASTSKTYYCTVTAEDYEWTKFVHAHGSEDRYKDFVSKYGNTQLNKIDPSDQSSYSVYTYTTTTELTIIIQNEMVVFLSPTTGKNEYTSDELGVDGKLGDVSHPVKTWQKAYSLLTDGATWDYNKIVLMGKSDRVATCGYEETVDGKKVWNDNGGFSITLSLQSNVPSESYEEWKGKVDKSHLAKNVTISGEHKGVDYGGIIEAYEDGNDGAKYIGLFGDTRFEHITFNHHSRGKHSSYIFCQYNSLEMGEGVRMTGFTNNAPGYGTIDGAWTSSFQIYGGLNNDARFRSGTTVMDKAIMEKMNEAMPHGKEGFSITLKSGHYSCVSVAGRQSTSSQLNGLMGTPTMPVKCTVTVDINRTFNDKPENKQKADYDCGIIMAGGHEGAMYFDSDIIIKSGYIARVVNGSLGNKEKSTFVYGGKEIAFPANTYMGRANILVDPRDENGNIANSKVIITELYGGSTGRGFLADNKIDNPFYGYSTVTINGGTFKVLPESNKTNPLVLCGIYGAGAGGYNGIGDANHPTEDKRIAYWVSDKIIFGKYDDAKDNLVSANCYNADGTYTEIDPTMTNTKIVINGGVFGASGEGNAIDGIYAGGSGYMSPGLFYADRVIPSTTAGNVYGKTGETISSLIINGGTFYCKHGIFAGGRGTDEYYSKHRIESTSYVYGIADGSHSDYDALGQTYGDVELTINGGTFNCDIFGGGYGAADAKLYNTSTYATLSKMARVYGKTSLTIGSSAANTVINGSVYGGGDMAVVDNGTSDATDLTIDGDNVVIYGDVFASGKGRKYRQNPTDAESLSPNYTYTRTADVVGLVQGNANLVISGDTKIHGNIYGGGAYASTVGNTSMTLNGTTLYYGENEAGRIYGGGLGYLDTDNTSANISGNTYIKIDKVDYDDGASNSAKYYVYGGGRTASEVGGKTEVILNYCKTADKVSVYGGGDGSNTYVNGNTYITVNEFETETTSDSGTTTYYGLSSIYGGGNAGDVKGKTNVALNGGQIFGDVFGGGNVAKVGTACLAYPYSGTAEEKEQYIQQLSTTYGTEISMQGVGPIIYGNIFGGGNKADVYGNTKVSVSNGTFAGEVFGGGNGDLSTTPITYANIYGSTHVYVNGASVIWNKMWNSSSKSFDEWDAYYTSTNEFIKAPTEEHPYPVFKNNHNIYAGGNYACMVGIYNDAGELVSETGVASVDVTKGFCGIDLLSTNVWKHAYNDNNNPHFYVFGGGYGAYTYVGSTKVNVGVNEAIPEDATTDQQLAKSTELTLDSKSMAPRKRISFGEGTDEATIGVYDNSYGIPGYTVLGVIGGGYAGLVKDDTDVTVGGNTYMHRVYGGGYGQLEAYNGLSAINPNVSTTDSRKLRDVLGEVGGNTKVVTDGGYIYGDVFGGGAGVESIDADNNEKKDTDFKDMGRVKGTTSVTISGKTQVFGSVYGGGDVANVGEENPPAVGEPESRSIFDVADTIITRKRYEHSNAQSFVNIIGGDIFGEVFAGGNGRMRADASDYRTLGRVEGNTLVHVADTQLDDGSTIVPTIWNRIFGGCSYGTVNGSTFVHIEGGMLGHNIFGGGLGDASTDTPDTSEGDRKGSYANVNGNTNVKIDGGTWLWNQFADTQGNITVWKNVSQKVANNLAEVRAMSVEERTAIIMKALDPRFVTGDANGNPHFVIAHNIFGGGKDACDVGTGAANTGKATVTINHSPLSRFTDASGNDINLLDETTAGGIFWYACISNIANPQFSVFGGGWGINTTVGETDVYVGPGARFNNTSEKLVLKPYDDDVEDSNLKYDSANPANNEKFYFTIDPTLGKEPYAYINDDISEYVIFENALLGGFNSVTPEDRIKLYGSADGGDTDTHTFLRYRASRLAMSLGVPTCTFMDIHGGGFSGYVTGNTKVVTDCQLACRNVFGGGLGSLPENPTGTETYGEVGGNAEVKLYSGFISLNVFGGGAGINSYKNGNTFIDFPDIARVIGKTNVEVWGEALALKSDVPNPDGEGYQTYDKERVLVFGNVYGGGDVANVYGVQEKSQIAAQIESASAKKKQTIHIENDGSYKDQDDESVDFTTSVSVYGGGIFTSVYAGGNGRTKDKCNDYTHLGAVYGNTHFYVENTKRRYPYVDDVELEKPVIPYIWNRIYGGCQNGKVYGNTFVDVNGGYLLYNIFGGGWGNVDSLEVNGVMTVDPDKITSADVIGNTNILIRNGEVKLNSLWDAEKRTWGEARVVNKNGERLLYSPQYEPDLKKFVINHNIYGGGRTACRIGGNTNVTMKRGLLHRNLQVVSGVNTEDVGGFFNTKEWEEVYHKVGSPHFCVFGGGYGENTVVENNTYLNIEPAKDECDIEDADVLHDVSQLHSHFYSNQAVMDVIGGGYSGIVRGTTNVNVGGQTFLRRVFGGGFYAPVGAANVNIKSIDCNDIFGGGLMGDVGFTEEEMYNAELTANPDNRGKVNVNIGTDNGNIGKSIWIHKNVYGGNDVSGDIFNKTTLTIAAGHVFGNVYGAGNGDYLYAVGRNKEKKVTVNEYYKVGKNTYDLVYTVPSRRFMTSLAASTPAQRMVNCSSYRPKVQNVEIYLSGHSDNPLELGGVFGGGNSATVNNINGSKPTVKFHFGNNLKITNVFMGCDGDAMFDGSEKFRKAYEDVNSLHLEDEIDWLNDPGNHSITEQYLPVSHVNRPKVYQHLLDLYFQPVEMDVQPQIKWDADFSTEAEEPISNVTIGSFFCGGNRGNMNVVPDNDGDIVRYTFPAGLVITDKIVGGCNMANYKMPNSDILHKGGYLLGERGKYAIELTVNCQFKPVVDNHVVVKESANVYGGCYTSGTIAGDVFIDIKSDMLANITPQELADANANNLAVCNVYGAGYGSLAYVRGNTKINLGQGVPKDNYVAATSFSDVAHGATVNYIYGGGQQGCLVGNSNIHVYNGHVASSVCGGSYSGLMWGSSHVLVGYPKYYEVNKSGTYTLQRADKWNNTDVIKKSINLLKGDVISDEVFDAIEASDASQASKGEGGNFKLASMTPADWDEIDIKIDEAVYGGGYSLASGSSVAAGTYTVKKFDAEENLDEFFSAEELTALGENGTKGFGGNTTLLVWDAPTNGSGSTDHISISSQIMKEKTGLSDTDDIFGYYYMDANNNYRYVYKEGYSKSNMPEEAKDYKIYEYNGDGGMYGDGHLSFAEGFRSGELYGYGFAGRTPENPKIINTFQRMDMLRVTDCAVVLLGARDYTVSEISTSPYSIARVGEIQMVAQNVTNRANGTFATTANSRSRNYLGLSNNIHYCGAIYSNVKMSDLFHDNDGVIPSSGKNNGKSYQQVKQDFIEDYYIDSENNHTLHNSFHFQQRNNATAANMIGISSGYALKVQSVKTKADGSEEIYYGPVIGVMEMKLIDVRQSEGGGYVYAKNIHHRPASSGSSKSQAPRKKSLSTDAENVPDHYVGEEDFLETSGNFVFPYDDTSNRYIVDDCFRRGYDAAVAANQTPEEMNEVHYWYVTGWDYYYNTTITGYTYNSSGEGKGKRFDADNEDALMNLAGTYAGADVKVKSIKWRTVHSTSDGFEDELEVRNLSDDPDCKDSSGNPVKGLYQLLIGASSETTYKPNGENGGVTGATNGAYLEDGLPFATTEYSGGKSFIPASGTDCDAANIVLQLVDNADNSGVEYYKKHLSEPCKATIVLESHAYDYVTTNLTSGDDIYVLVDGRYVKQSESTPAGPYYQRKRRVRYDYDETVVTGDDVSDKYIRDDNSEVGFIPAPTATATEGQHYYSQSEATFTYTIYLTISYVQGPNATGALKVENCALPGEMIEINKGDIEITADQSMAQCATIYRIGPRGDDNGWKDDNPYDATSHPYGYYTYEVGKPYSAENSSNATSEMLAGVVYDESNTTNPCIRVPAYYFMNGYGVQYCFKVSGLDDIFNVAMTDDSKLTIHNYHRMEPRRSGGGIYEGDQALDLHLDLAAKRAAETGSDLPEPRIYIEDETDLIRFAAFINEKTDDEAAVGSKYDFGANMQFVLQDDITVGPAYVAPDKFKGTFHGDGHAITGIGKNGLFKALEGNANIHNLGFVTGKIVGGSNSENNEKLHCCYEYAQNTVYGIDGTAETGYTADDWRYGKVAYDLNGYYLHKRALGDAATNTYVEDYYANGDYLYAGYSFENHYEGAEYLRNSYLPTYGYASTAHDMTHRIDESRAVMDNEDNLTGYKPLFDDNNLEDGKPKNDYIFFGQILNAETKGNDEGLLNLTIPGAIATDEESNAIHLTEDMDNRVYRAGGYYGSNVNNGFHYNAGAYVHDNGITAIDFHDYTNTNYNEYGMASIAVDAGVTRNLLLYAHEADRSAILSAFDYTEDTPEADIRAHILDEALVPTTEYLHLVERTADDKDSEGGECLNNDFNCPIPFTVTKRAWYTRVPRYYAANSNDAWEGISLPFSVNRVEASFSGEISHFYGGNNANAANATSYANTTSAGHEYWLRGLTGFTASAGEQPAKAAFKRPGSGLFEGGDLTADYNYRNSHFYDIYGEIYGEGGFSIYNGIREFTGYYFQKAYVPYIVSFPGATFKEFDLSGDYNQSLILGNHVEWDALTDAHGFSFKEEAMKPQNVTFSWYCDNGKEGDNNKVGAAAEGTITIGKTDVATAYTIVGAVKHHAAFSAMSEDDTYAMNEYGTAFDAADKDVLPFRTYMTVTASPSKAFAKPKSILIYENGGIDELPQADDSDNSGLRIYSKNRKIYVESPVAMSLSLYTATGQLVRVFDVVPGTNTYSGFANGIYIVGKKKLYVK